MKNIDLAWAAGFFDGEGCISFARRQRTKAKNLEYELTLIIGQANISPLRKFHKIFGGKIRLDSLAYFRWTCNYKESLQVLVLLQPFLFLKQKEAKLALLYKELYLGKGTNITKDLLEKRNRLYRAIKRKKVKYKKYINNTL